MSGLKIAVTLVLFVATPHQRLASVRAAADPPGTARLSRGPPSLARPAATGDRIVLTRPDAQGSLRGAWADGIAAFDAAHQHLLVMADRHSDAMNASLTRLRE